PRPPRAGPGGGAPARGRQARGRGAARPAPGGPRDPRVDRLGGLHRLEPCRLARRAPARTAPGGARPPRARRRLSARAGPQADFTHLLPSVTLVSVEEDRALTASTDQRTEPHEPRRRLLRRLGKVAEHRRPGARGAAAALALATAAVLAWSTWDQHVPGTAAALASHTALNVLVATAGAGLATGLLFVTIGRFQALPWAYLWTLLACLILLATLGAGASLTGWLAAIAVLAAGASLLGGALGGPPPHAGRGPARARNRRLLALALAVVLLAAPTIWLLTATQGSPAPPEEGTA